MWAEDPQASGNLSGKFELQRGKSGLSNTTISHTSSNGKPKLLRSVSVSHIQSSIQRTLVTSFEPNDVTVGAQASIRSHICNTCQLDWPMPRDILWPKQAVPPEGLFSIRPDTPETIVVYQTFDREKNPTIPAAVFKTFTFAMEGSLSDGPAGSRNLVEGIRYDRNSGSVTTSTVDAPSNTQAYLRIMHLNNWYWQLFVAVVTAVWKVMELESNMMLSAALFSDPDLIKALGSSRWAFIPSWIFLFLVSVYWAYCEACMEWITKTNPAKGDLISNCSRYSRLRTFLSMVAFEFFLIPKDVKDVVINLHPWKGVQDYSAFKAEGHRAFFVGYRSKTMHTVENFKSVWKNLPTQVLTKTLVFVFKVFFMYELFVFENKKNWSYTLVLATFGSICALSSDLYMLWYVFCLRRKFRKRLMRRLSESSHSSPKQRQADIRLLAMHFHRRWDPDEQKLRKFRRGELKNGEWVAQKANTKGQDEKCKSCGRIFGGAPESPMTPKTPHCTKMLMSMDASEKTANMAPPAPDEDPHSLKISSCKRPSEESKGLPSVVSVHSLNLPPCPRNASGDGEDRRENGDRSKSSKTAAVLGLREAAAPKIADTLHPSMSTDTLHTEFLNASRAPINDAALGDRPARAGSPGPPSDPSSTGVLSDGLHLEPPAERGFEAAFEVGGVEDPNVERPQTAAESIE